MKKLGNTALSLLLSLMITYLASGVAVIYCSHSDTTSIVNPVKADRCPDECPVKSPCMSVTVVKLVTYTKSLVHDFSVIPFTAFTSNTSVPYYQYLARNHDRHANDFHGWMHSPPREYLRLINILLI